MKKGAEIYTSDLKATFACSPVHWKYDPVKVVSVAPLSAGIFMYLLDLASLPSCAWRFGRLAGELLQ